MSFLKDKNKYSLFISIMGTVMSIVTHFTLYERQFKLRHKLLGCILKHKLVAALRGKKCIKKKEQKKSFFKASSIPLIMVVFMDQKRHSFHEAAHSLLVAITITTQHASNGE